MIFPLPHNFFLICQTLFNPKHFKKKKKFWFFPQAQQWDNFDPLIMETCSWINTCVGVQSNELFHSIT